jgi:hypothetical protein
MDLVEGMLRQLKFVNKICENFDFWSNEAVISTSIERYIRFIAAMKAFPELMFVPTLDIDLVWHAHQTFDPVMYRDYTKKIVGKVVSHDDDVEQESLDDSFSSTIKAWFELYNEEYTTQNPELTTSGML